MFKSTSLHLCINLTASSNDCFTARWDAWVWDCTWVLLNSEDKLWKKKSAHGLAELIICKKKRKRSQTGCKLTQLYPYPEIIVFHFHSQAALCKPRGCHTFWLLCLPFFRDQYYVETPPRKHNGIQLQTIGLKPQRLNLKIRSSIISTRHATTWSTAAKRVG